VCLGARITKLQNITKRLFLRSGGERPESTVCLYSGFLVFFIFKKVSGIL